MSTEEKKWLSGLPENLTVGFVIEGMSPGPSGTWTRFQNMVRALSSVGIAVHVLGTRGIHDSVMDLPVESFELQPKKGSISRFLARRSQIDTFAAKTSAHVVHLEAPPFVETNSVPTIAAVHDLRHFYPSSRSLLTGEALYQLLFLRSHIRKFRMIYALSSWASDEIQRILSVDPSKTWVVPPIVETPLFSAEDIFPRPKKEKYAFALGHIERRKNLSVIIAASAKDAWPQDVALVIAGKDQGSLEDLAELNCSLGGRAIFIGPIHDDEKWDLLRGATVVLLPSTVEGFGILATEAPIAGRPILVARSSSLGKLSGHPRALLEPNDPDIWAVAVSAVANDEKLSDEIVRAQQSSAEKFSSTSVLETIFASYRALIGTPPSAERK